MTPRCVPPREEAAHEQHERDEHHDLDQREVAPGRGRPLVGGARRRPPGSRPADGGLRSAAAARCAASRSARVDAPPAVASAGTAALAARLPMAGVRRRGAGSTPRPPANGQPDEMTTRHQFISMPSSPQRGRDVPVLAARLADVLVADATHLCSSGAEHHLLDPAAVQLLDVGAVAEQRSRVSLQPVREVVAQLLELREATAGAGRAARGDAEVEALARVGGAEERGELAPRAGRSGRAGRARAGPVSVTTG